MDRETPNLTIRLIYLLIYKDAIFFTFVSPVSTPMPDTEKVRNKASERMHYE